MEEKERTEEEIFRETFQSGQMGTLSEEGLKHLDNVINGMVELRKIHSTQGGNQWMWMVLLMFLFGFPMDPALLESTIKEGNKDETN